MTSVTQPPGRRYPRLQARLYSFLSLSYIMQSITGRLAPPSFRPLLLSLIHSEQRNAYFTVGAPFLKFSAPDRCF